MLDRLSVATFKGVRFACNDTTTTAGRALIKHEFANSDQNNIEDQGLNPRTYSLTALIFGDNYERDRDQLLAAIESSGSGVLTHPFYGRIENAVALPVTYSETVKRLGRVEIPITFEISESTGIPSVSLNSTGALTNGKGVLQDAIILDFADNFTVTNSFTGNFKSAQSKLTGFAGAIGDNVTVTSVTAGAAATYRAQIDTFTRNINSLIGTPDALATSVVTLIEDISGLYDTAEQTLDVARRFFTFGDDDTPIIANTAGLIERQNNNQTFNDSVKASALSIAYEAAGLTTYRTVSEVDSVSRELETIYRSLKG